MEWYFWEISEMVVVCRLGYLGFDFGLFLSGFY